MSAAPRGRAGLWQALATAVDETVPVGVPVDAFAFSGVGAVDDALDPSTRYAEHPHLGYLARVRGGMAGHPAAGHPSPAPASSSHGGDDDEGLVGDDVIDLTAYRARRRARLGA